MSFASLAIAIDAAGAAYVAGTTYSSNFPTTASAYRRAIAGVRDAFVTKLDAAGASRSVVGLTVPTGYSFNLDGTCIYLTMGALFIAQATGHDIGIGTQIGLLLFMLISSKGAAGVTGAGLVTLAASLSAFGTVIPVVGIALIVGIDRFMSEARALTNVIGSGVGSLVIARWQGELDRDRLKTVLDNPTTVDVERAAEELAGTP